MEYFSQFLLLPHRNTIAILDSLSFYIFFFILFLVFFLSSSFLFYSFSFRVDMDLSAFSR